MLSKAKIKSITDTIFRIQSNCSVMCEFCCITFAEYMITGKTLLFDYTNLFSFNDYQMNVKIIYKYFKDKYGKRKRKP